MYVCMYVCMYVQMYIFIDDIVTNPNLIFKYDLKNCFIFANLGLLKIILKLTQIDIIIFSLITI